MAILRVCVPLRWGPRPAYDGAMCTASFSRLLASLEPEKIRSAVYHDHCVVVKDYYLNQIVVFQLLDQSIYQCVASFKAAVRLNPSSS